MDNSNTVITVAVIMIVGIRVVIVRIMGMVLMIACGHWSQMIFLCHEEEARRRSAVFGFTI